MSRDTYDEQVAICNAFNERQKHRELARQEAFKEGAEAMRQLCIKAFAGVESLSGPTIVECLAKFDLPSRLFDVQFATPADFEPLGAVSVLSYLAVHAEIEARKHATAPAHPLPDAE